MKRTAALLLAALSLSTLHAEDWQPEAGFTSLFNGKDLTGWCFREKTKKDDPNPGAITAKHDGKTEAKDAGQYFVKDGIFTVNFPTEMDKLTGQIYTVAEFPTNFVLKLEFRAGVNADSGIFVRKPQLQCRDYLVAGPFTDLKAYKPQEWNQIEVTVKDGVTVCTCNGEVLPAVMPMPPTGPIGLEGDRGVMEYRHIQLKELK
ncbi:MAG: DUF1080 domain-containing protein [Verrucomicrobia bacterium]|uniref:DUF1080 domain-containing protein n=1 Tax=Prosthecobacter sp. TaxID=1965333 RepID=UPI001AC4E500|nr:DUF1080 domain-containing protein [Verrucomicrobiota bacterium]